MIYNIIINIIIIIYYNKNNINLKLLRIIAI